MKGSFRSANSRGLAAERLKVATSAIRAANRNEIRASRGYFATVSQNFSEDPLWRPESADIKPVETLAKRNFTASRTYFESSPRSSEASHKGHAHNHEHTEEEDDTSDEEDAMEYYSGDFRKEEEEDDDDDNKDEL